MVVSVTTALTSQALDLSDSGIVMTLAVWLLPLLGTVVFDWCSGVEELLDSPAAMLIKEHHKMHSEMDKQAKQTKTMEIHN